VRPVVFSGRDHSQHRAPHRLRGMRCGLAGSLAKAPVTSLTADAASTAPPTVMPTASVRQQKNAWHNVQCHGPTEMPSGYDRDGLFHPIHIVIGLWGADYCEETWRETELEERACAPIPWAKIGDRGTSRTGWVRGLAVALRIITLFIIAYVVWSMSSHCSRCRRHCSPPFGREET
jgi:hypothetical protein